MWGRLYLGGDGDESYTFGFDGVELVLKSSDGDVAVWAPGAAVEGNQKRTILEQRGAGDGIAVRVWQLEVWKNTANLDDILRAESGFQFGFGVVDWGDNFCWVCYRARLALAYPRCESRFLLKEGFFKPILWISFLNGLLTEEFLVSSIELRGLGGYCHDCLAVFLKCGDLDIL